LYGLPWHGVLLAYLISESHGVEDGEAAASNVVTTCRDVSLLRLKLVRFQAAVKRKSKHKIGFGESDSFEPSVLEPKSVTATTASTSEGFEAML
jgi:hypothetical protein